jgi:hypothetical protein
MGNCLDNLPSMGNTAACKVDHSKLRYLILLAQVSDWCRSQVIKLVEPHGVKMY